MTLLIQFLLRLSCGLAAAMATVSPRKVTSGYFRNHLYVVLGLSSLAALLSRAAAPSAFAWAIIAAVVSYVGSIAWLYEKALVGCLALIAVALAAGTGALSITTAQQVSDLQHDGAAMLRNCQAITSSMLLGTTMAAMLLGHWYLNAPGMELLPLRRLLIAMAIAVVLHASVCGVGLASEAADHTLSMRDWLFILLRWSFGLAGILILIGLAWQTLKIPNTQSATGILYVAVIGVCVGETMSLLLSAETVFPV
jgi:hypothetical protein